jgi:uroporphyrinogen decarboxylase
LTPKDRALAAFARKKPDRVPLCIFLGGSWPVINSGTTLKSLIGRPKETAELFWDVNRRLGADIVMVGAGATALQIKVLGGDVRFNDNGAPEIMGEPVKKPDDLQKLTVSQVYGDRDVRWLVETCEETMKIAGSDALVLASGRAPFTLAGQIYGLENFSRALYKDKKFAHELLEFTTALSSEYYREMIINGHAHGAFIADPTASGDCISKKHFEEFALPYLTRVVDGIKQMHCPAMLHICGNITDRLPLIPDSGADCISIDTKVEISDAAQLAGERICIAGNVDPVNTLEFGSADDVRRVSLKCLRDGAKNGGFVLTPGCDFGAGVTEENLKALSSSITEYNN